MPASAINEPLRLDPRDVRKRWAVILAGGDGTRLLPLTRQITGDDRPKQFCVLSGGETLLEQTQHRVRQVVPAENVLILLTRTHEPYYRNYFSNVAPANLLIQPSNCGTATAIAFALTRLQPVNAHAVVGFFPSDHYFSNTGAFARCINQAYAFAEARRDKVVLLGIAADAPEISYGWIEPGARLQSGAVGDFFEVCQFQEKPSAEIADRLMASRCLWNSFVMVGQVGTFRDLIRRALPELLDAFESLPGDLGEFYRRTAPRNFSVDVLAAGV